MFRRWVVWLAALLAMAPGAAHAKYLYVSGGYGNNVLRYNASTGAFVDVFVKPGSGGLNNAQGLAFGTDGNLYVAGFGSGVTRYDGTTGAFIGTFGSGLESAKDLVFGPDGNLYVSDTTGNQVVRFDGKTGAFIDAFVPNTDQNHNQPQAIAFGPDGDLYMTDDYFIVQYDGKTGAFKRLMRSVTIGQPQGLAFGSCVASKCYGLYVSSWNNNSVSAFDSIGGYYLAPFVAPGSGGLSGGVGVAFGPDYSLYVSSWNSNAVLRYDAHTGAFKNAFVTAGSGGLSTPTFILFH